MFTMSSTAPTPQYCIWLEFFHFATVKIHCSASTFHNALQKKEVEMVVMDTQRIANYLRIIATKL